MNTYILLKVTHKKPDPDLLEKVAGRAWTMDNVEDVTATKIEESAFEAGDLPALLKRQAS